MPRANTAPPQKIKSLRPFFDQLDQSSTSLDDMLAQLDLSKEETESLINSAKYRTHRALRAQLIQQQLQIVAQNNARHAIQTLLNLTDSNHPAIARLAATQILQYAGTPPIHDPPAIPSPQIPNPYFESASPRQSPAVTPAGPCESAPGALPEIPPPQQKIENQNPKLHDSPATHAPAPPNVLLLATLLLQIIIAGHAFLAGLRAPEALAYITRVQSSENVSGEPVLIAAEAVAPMDPAFPPVMRNAAVVFSGKKILAVGELSDLRRQFGDLPAAPDRLKGVLLPGFINAHIHLELSNLAGALGDFHEFPAWVDRLMQSLPQEPLALENFVRDSVRRGAAESLKAGITTLGDITRNPAITRSELAALHGPADAGTEQPPAAPRVISFGEVVGLGSMRHRLFPMLDAAAAPVQAPDDLLSIGLSPHAPFTVEGPALRKIVGRAIIKRLPLCMHLAEHREEADFLRDFSGPLGRSWTVMQRLNILDDQVPAFNGGPIRWGQLWGLLVTDPMVPPPRDLPVLLAHVNHCDNAELAQLAGSHVSVAYCPRTREFFGHERTGPHRYRDMLDAGINVCLGTDSLASNPDLSVLAEAGRLCERDALPALAALDMITRRAATALGRRDTLGSLAPEKLADVQWREISGVDAMDDARIFEAIVNNTGGPAGLWLSGRRIF